MGDATVAGDTYTTTVGAEAAALVTWAVSNDNTATLLAAAINALPSYNAVAAANVVTVTAAAVGAAGNVAITTVTTDGGGVAPTAVDTNLTGGLDAVAALNDGTDTVISNSRVNALYLYNGTTLVDQVSGSSIGTDGVATFDGFNVKIAKNSSVRFTVTTDILDAAANANDTIRFNLAGYSVEDEDADDVFSSSPADADGILAD